MKGLFIPEITAEMFRNGCLESIETLMAEGEIYDIEYSQWIPVSERLPKSNGVYAVTRRLFDDQIDIEPYYFVDACYFDGTDTWHNDNRINHSRHPLDDITAWMPLPEPHEIFKQIRQMCEEKK